MLSSYSKNFSQEEPFTIASLDVIYRSNWLERTPEIEDLLNFTIGHLNSLNRSRYERIAITGGFNYLKAENESDSLRIIKESRISLFELYEIQAFFHLFMRDLPYSLTLKDVQSVEKVVLASLFLDRNQIPIKFRYIYDLIHRIPIEKFKLSYTLPDHWEIPLPDQTREVSSLGLEEGTATLEDLVTLRTRSYYHIQKDELMEKVRHLLRYKLSSRWYDDEPKNVDDMNKVQEVYGKLLDYRGAIMWETAALQFPDDKVIFVWNRSMTSQSLERAWHLPTTSERMNYSIPYFKVTHHREIKDEDRLIPIIDAEVWTNIQLRDALGYDWMYDQSLTSEGNQKLTSKESLTSLMRDGKSISKNDWIDVRKFVDLKIIKKALSWLISSNLSINDNSEITGSDRLFLEEFKPEQMSEHFNNSEPVNYDRSLGSLGSLENRINPQDVYKGWDPEEFERVEDILSDLNLQGDYYDESYYDEDDIEII